MNNNGLHNLHPSPYVTRMMKLRRGWESNVARTRRQECTQNFNRTFGVVFVKMDLEAVEYESIDLILMDI